MTYVFRRAEQPKPSKYAKRQFQRRFRILSETAPETIFFWQNETAETIPKPPLKLGRNRFFAP
jgi:hypothetical protein